LWAVISGAVTVCAGGLIILPLDQPNAKPSATERALTELRASGEKASEALREPTGQLIDGQNRLIQRVQQFDRRLENAVR
jgi:hypothetical protein